MAFEIAWANAVDCIPDSRFFEDLAQAVSNDPNDVDSAKRWILVLINRYLGSEYPFDAYDFCICDLERISKCWEAFCKALDLHEEQGLEAKPDTLPALSRYLIERLPAFYDHFEQAPRMSRCRPVTSALRLAHWVDTLIGFFAVGIRPTGSKDPYALRRTANHFLREALLAWNGPDMNFVGTTK